MNGNSASRGHVHGHHPLMTTLRMDAQIQAREHAAPRTRWAAVVTTLIVGTVVMSLLIMAMGLFR